MPHVADAVVDARRACDALARQPALSRTLPPLQAEASLRAAQAGLALDGVRLALDTVRDVARGLAAPPPGPTGTMVVGALRLAADVQREVAASGEWLPTGHQPLPQRLAHWHATVSAGLGAGVPGRLREHEQPGDLRGLGDAPVGAELSQRMAGLAALVAQPLTPSVSGLVVAAVVHGELLAMRPFAHSNGAVARAVLRWQIGTLGVDRTATVAPEVVWADAPDRYVSAAAGYATGEWPRVVAWVRTVASAVLRGADLALDLAQDAAHF